MALERVLAFLAQDAAIPHLRLLPYRSPLTVLSAFFDRYPTPSPRSRRLLTRWLWRGAAREELRGDRTVMRAALDALRTATSDDSAAALVLATVSKAKPQPPTSVPFNLHHARPRLLAIAMAEMRPQNLITGEAIDLPRLLDSEEDSFLQLFGRRPDGDEAGRSALFSSVGNRIIHPKTGGASLLSLLQTHVPRHVLASHAVTQEMMVQLRSGDKLAFLSMRRSAIEVAAENLIDSRAEWEHADRPSLDAMGGEDD